MSTRPLPLSLHTCHPRFVALHKPANLSFHQEEGQASLIDLARQQFPELGALWSVHRLDRITSGLLLLARDAATASELGILLSQRRLDKRYIALSAYKPSKKQGWVKGDMQAGRQGNWRLLQSQQDPAITQFISAACTTPNGQVHPAPAPLRLFLLKPHTGRTHQLRVMMKALGSPILGDARYAGGASDRAYLHAYRLRFSLNDEPFDLCAPPADGQYWPPHLEEQLAQLEATARWPAP